MKPAALTLVAAVVLTLVASSTVPVSAQANLSGTWSLDRDISGDPTRTNFDPEPQQQPRRSPGGFGGGIGGLGRRGGFGGGRPSGGSGGNGGSGGTESGGDSRNSSGTLTVDEETRLRELTDYVKQSFGSLVISHADPTFAVTDPQGRTHVFLTDGTKTQHSLATATVESTTSWDGPRLVTEYTVTSTRKLLFTYVLLPATKQLVLRIRLEESARRRADGDELRLVYRLKASASAAPPASPAPAAKPLAYDAFGGGHLIHSVSDEGRYVTLEDGSFWEVNPDERFKSADWQPLASMTVRAARGENGYDYELVNTTDDEGVLAKHLPKPAPKH